MNFRRAVIAFAITSFVLSIASFAALCANWGNRLKEWDFASEADNNEGEGENEKWEGRSDLKERGHEKEGFQDEKEPDFAWAQKRAHFSPQDLALMAGCGIIGIILGIWYELLVMMWAYRKSYHMGANSTVWVLAALFFNLAGIAALYLYALWKGTCSNCGRIRDSNGKYCDRCGAPLRKYCPHCGQETALASVCCAHCGKKLDDNEE